jgi:hypothetical protein
MSVRMVRKVLPRLERHTRVCRQLRHGVGGGCRPRNRPTGFGDAADGASLGRCRVVAVVVVTTAHDQRQRHERHDNPSPRASHRSEPRSGFTYRPGAPRHPAGGFVRLSP